MFANWVKETTTTTGTGTLTLTAVTGFPRFGNAFINGQPMQYSILDSTGAPVEAGVGHYVSLNQLARDKVQSKFVGGVLTQAGATQANLGTDNTNSPWTVIATPVAQGIMTQLPGISGSAPAKIVLPYPYTNSGNTKTLTANVPFVIGARFDVLGEVTALGVNVTTAAGVGTDRIQVGLYPVLPDGTSAPLLVRSGDINPSTTGLKSVVPSGGANVFVPPGWYYIVIASSVAPVLRAGSTGTSILPHVGPLGTQSTDMIAIGYALAPTLTVGWTALPSALGALSSFTDITVDFPPLAFLVIA